LVASYSKIVILLWDTISTLIYRMGCLFLALNYSFPSYYQACFMKAFDLERL